MAAAAHAPFISAASHELFGLESFSDIGKPRDLAKIFDTVEYAKWKSFRESEDSRYVALCVPHTLQRLPYGSETVPVEAFNFEENVDGTDHSKYLWGNAAYSLGTRITDSFSKHGWLATIRGVEGGGLVEGLPTHTFKTDEGEVAMKCPTEIAITDRREKELNDLGFITLCHCKGTDYAAFFGAQSTQKAKVYDRDDANANARLSTQLQYILCTSRFAHYLKAMARDKIGSFMERDECEQWLNRWISNYVLSNPESAGAETKAKYPLREAKVVVRDVKGKPGCYEAVAHLRPHFQLEELFRIVAAGGGAARVQGRLVRPNGRHSACQSNPTRCRNWRETQPNPGHAPRTYVPGWRWFAYSLSEPVDLVGGLFFCAEKPPNSGNFFPWTTMIMGERPAGNRQT